MSGELADVVRDRFEDGPDVVYLQCTSPPSFVPRAGRCTVGFTMVERENLSTYPRGAEWAPMCNAMTSILTPTEWNRAVFENHGIRRVRVVPLGVDVERFTPKPYRFVSVVPGFRSAGSRSNWRDLVGAFRSEFKNCRDVELTILVPYGRRLFRFESIRSAPRELAWDLRETRRTGPRSLPRISIERIEHVAAEEMAAKYRDYDCYVSYSREGWGMPALEAMSTSLSIVAPDYGAPLAYLRDSDAVLFDPGRLSTDNRSFVQDDLSSLRQGLRTVYDKARAPRRHALKHSWDRSAQALRGALQAVHTEWAAEPTG
jgi:glycosyltransferase involved in cell wall biosynthesis